MKYKNLCRASIKGAQGKESFSFIVLDKNDIPNGETPSKRDIGHFYELEKKHEQVA